MNQQSEFTPSSIRLQPTQQPEISILILTHNQRLSLERCLESVLNQEIMAPYEIIVSDDRSTDGTEELVKSISGSDRVKKNKYLLGLYYIYCNSDDCSPETTTQRIGWNRLTAYKHARGKYFVNVDADDFLVGTDLYQKEYELLETHLECSMVQSRLLLLDNGECINNVRKGRPYWEGIKSETVFSLEEVLRYGLRGQHQTYMYRRRPQDDMERLLGYNFEDIYITYYHLQYGPMVFLDRAGYVWVQYPNSSSRGLNRDELRIEYGLIPLSLAMHFNNSRNVFIKYGINKMWRMVFGVQLYPEVGEERRKSWSKNRAFIYRFYSENFHGVYSWFRYCLIGLTLLMLRCFHLRSNFWLDFLYRVMV